MRDATLAMTMALGLVAGQLQAAPPEYSRTPLPSAVPPPK